MDSPNDAAAYDGSQELRPQPYITTDQLLAMRHGMQVTDREREMLRYLAAGYSSDQIGMLLYITKQTVDCHRKNIIKKLGVPNITAAVAYALRHRLIS